MKRLIFALSLVLFASAVAAAKDVVLRVATLAPEGTSWHTGLVELGKELEGKSKGAVKLKLFPGGMAGDELAVLKKLKVGQLQGAGLTGMGLGQIAPQVRVLELPFQYRSYAEVDAVRAKVEERIRAEFEKHGYVVVGISESGFGYIFSNKELKSVADVKNAKPWMWEGDQLAAATYEAFGVHPTPLAVQDVITSLETGLIDTVYASPAACNGLQWASKLKYMIDVPLADGTSMTVVTKTSYDRLDDDQKKLLIDAGKRHHETLIQQVRKENEEARKTLKEEFAKRGGRIIEWDPKERESFEAIGRKVTDGFAGDGDGKLYPKPLLDDVLATIAAARGGK